MIVTCGIALINPKNEILIAHPTRAPWNTWSIPKGEHDHTGTYKETAIREFKEETGLDLISAGVKLFELGMYEYPKKRGKVLKGFYGFLEENIDLTFFKCDSMVEHVRDYQHPFFEVDAFTWLPWIEARLGMLHYTQMHMLQDIEELERRKK